MGLITELPWVPLTTLLLIVPLIVWQINLYFKEKQKNRTPKVPQLNNQNKTIRRNQEVKNVTLISDLIAKSKSSRKTSLLFSITLGVFVIVNVFIVTFYLSNRKISFLPRANQSLTPTITDIIAHNAASVTLTVAPTIAVKPEVNNSTQPSSPPLSTTSAPRPSITKIISTVNPTIAPTLTPTSVPSPTSEPTLMAQAYSVPTNSPSPMPTANPSPSPTLIISTVSPTPAFDTNPTTIPIVGIEHFSLILAGLSIFFLILGFVF